MNSSSQHQLGCRVKVRQCHRRQVRSVGARESFIFPRAVDSEKDQSSSTILYQQCLIALSNQIITCVSFFGEALHMIQKEDH